MLSRSLRILRERFSQPAWRARPQTRPFRKGHFQPRIDFLEDRSLLSTFMVTNTADDGPGSLHQAILDANANPGTTNDIQFRIIDRLNLHSILVGQVTHIGLPLITNSLVLDATTQPDYQGRPVVVIDGGSATTGGTNGLEIMADGSTVRGLVISNFTGTGLVLRSNGNVVEGNYIGTNAVGSVPNPNLLGGVAIFSSNNNVIGGTTIAGTSYRAGNVISGNGRNGSGDGIDLRNASNNRIQGNYIGMNSVGSGSVSNSRAGIVLEAVGNGCQNNLIGTNGDGADDVAERNVISGNSGNGVGINGTHTQHNVVAGNYIGTNAAGDGAFPNNSGVFLGNGAQSNIIGTNGDGRLGNAAEGNLISGNSQSGISINGTGTNSNVVAGNYIGTNAAGNQFLRNGVNGIRVDNGPSGNRIGIDHRDPAYLLERNVISGNNFNGVDIQNGSNANIVAGNYIGTTAAGTAGLGNLRAGVYLNNRSDSNWIGTGGSGPADVAERNVIAANGYDGVQIINSRNNSVAGNYIGTDVGGTRNLGNGGGCAFPGCNGVDLSGGSQGNVIGVEGDGSQGDEARRNVVSGNANHGIGIFDSSTIRNVVAGNYIGTNAAGDQALSNGWNGIVINAAGQNRIGVDINHFAHDLERNVIGANGTGPYGRYGILLTAGANANTVAGNYIGTDATGSVALGSPSHFYGVGLDGGATNNLIGGTVVGARNVISGNIFGVAIFDSGTTGNLVQGNAIGTQADGVSPLGNLAHGIFIFNDASRNTIGGSVPEAGNVIAYNGGSGVVVASGTANVIRLNSVFANVGLGIDLGADGVTPNNDCNQADGPNHLQNYPVLAAAQSGDTTTVTGTLNSLPDTTFTLDFYANSVADPTGYGQGERYLGSATVTTGDACESDTFQVLLNAPTQDGEAVSATATDPDSNTSEFSAVVYAAATGSPAATVYLVSRSRRLPGSDRAAGPGSVDTAIAGALQVVGNHPLASFFFPPALAPVTTFPLQEGWSRELDERVSALRMPSPVAVDRLFATAGKRSSHLLLGSRPGSTSFSQNKFSPTEDNCTLEWPMNGLITEGFPGR